MEEPIKTVEYNPRGIPKAIFVEDISNLITNEVEDYQKIMNFFQARLNQYKYMKTSKKQQQEKNNYKILDLKKNLEVIKFLVEQKNDVEEEDKKIETLFDINQSLYTKAVIDVEKLETVYLWLGADVMLEYTFEDANNLLNSKIEKFSAEKKIIKEDLEFLKNNITTMEVNIARLYNWKVESLKKNITDLKI